MLVVIEPSLPGTKEALLHFGRSSESPGLGHTPQDADLTGLGCGVLGSSKIVKGNYNGALPNKNTITAACIVLHVFSSHD